MKVDQSDRRASRWRRRWRWRCPLAARAARPRARPARAGRLRRRAQLERVAEPAHEPLTGGKTGGTLNVLDHNGLRTHRPGRSPTTRSTTRSCYATQRPLYSYKPNTSTEASPGPRLRAAGNLRRRQDGHGPHPRRRPLQPAGEPRSDLRRRRLRDRARRQPERRQPLLPRLLRRRSKGCPRPTADRSRASPRRTSTRSSSTSPNRRRRSCRRARAAADARRCRRNTPKSTTRTSRPNTATTRSPRARTCSRTNSDGQGARRRLHPGQVGDARAQPELERRAPTSGPAYLERNQHQDRRRPNSVIGRQVLAGIEHRPERTARPVDRQGSLRKLPEPAGDLAGRRQPLHRRQQQAWARSPTSTCARRSGRRSTAWR